MNLLQGMTLGFWVALAVVAIAMVSLMSCHLGGSGLASCGRPPYLAFLLGTFAVMGTVPIFAIGLIDQITGEGNT